MTPADLAATPRFADARKQPRAVEIAKAIVEARSSWWVQCEGDSMLPTLRHGDAVLLTPVSVPVRSGDIVLVELQRAAVLHRVCGVTMHGVRTRGDAAGLPDPPLPHGAIIATARARRRGRSVAALCPTTELGAMPLLRYLVLEMSRHWHRFHRRAISEMRIGRVS